MSARVDFSDRQTLLRSWLATLHGTGLVFQPDGPEPLAPLKPLLRTALAWHLAYCLISYGCAMVVAQGGSDSTVARAVASGGTGAVLALTLVLWWGAIGLSSVLWWSAVLRERGATRQPDKH